MVYYLNGKSFNGLHHYEELPLYRLEMMLEIHLEAIEAEKKAYKRGK